MWKKSGKTNTDKPVAATARMNPWHAVSILTGPTSCGPARSLSALRFLSPEAPRLPLSQCPTPESCLCGYKHHTDRRAQARRKEDRTGLRRLITGDLERRTRQDRRSTD
jgi:hypothetical protein